MVSSVFSSHYQQIKEWWHHYPLKDQIEQLKDKPFDLEVLLTIHSEIAKHINERHYNETIKYFSDAVNKLTDSDLNLFINAIVNKQYENKEQGNIDALSKILDYDRLKQVIAKQKNDMEYIQKTLEGVKNCTPSHPLTKETAAEKKDAPGMLMRFLQSFLSTFMSAHDFSLESTPPVDRWDANMRLINMYILLDKPLKILQWFVECLSSLSPFTWVPYLIVSLGLLFSVIGLKSLSTKMNDLVLVNYTNLTKEAEQNPSRPFFGRTKAIDELVMSLQGEPKDHRHYLLVGKTGCGKTKIVEEVARRLIGKKEIFHINTAELTVAGGNIGPRICTRMDLLQMAIKRDTDRAVLFFDEMQALIPGKEGAFTGDLSQQIQTLLDKRIHCIGATTIEHYQDKIAPVRALRRRFHPIWIDDMSPANIESIVKRIIGEEYPQVRMPSNDVLKKLIADSDKIDSKVAQPDKAIDLAIDVMETFVNMPGPQKEKYLEAVNEKKELSDQMWQDECPLSNAKDLEKLSELTRTIQHLEPLAVQEDEKNQRMQELNRESKEWKRRMMYLANQMQSGENDPEVAKRFFLIKDYLLPQIYPVIAKLEVQKVDSPFIDSVMKERTKQLPIG